MNNYIDIAKHLEAAKPGLTLGPDEHYEINDDKNIMVQVDALQRKNKGDKDQFDALTSILELFFGKDQLAKMEENHPGVTTRISSMTVLMTATMAAISGEEFEDTKARFRENK